MNKILIPILIIFMSLVSRPTSSSTLVNNDKDREGLLNRLFAPGLLSRPHKDLEQGNCLKCHDASKGVPDKLCLDCHKDIALSKQHNQSYHSQLTPSCY